MSRVGKKPIEAVKGVDVKVASGQVTVKGPKGELTMALSDEVSVKVENGEVTVAARNPDERKSKAMWGTVRANIQNMVTGVTTGFTKDLELVGVGYRAAMKGKDLELSLGYSHPVVYKAPAGITFTSAKPTEIKISGANKQTVGQVAAEIRSWRPPEPYKGKGVRKVGEFVRRKEGKKK
ncbi:MAG: 50S ribosomal protein L6 [Alphaproteobacteria bacterium]|jgi:large subunit ribosomal protein L6|nr:MAG: 50S ribosomal protein L6 [Alphaproteobacteria bacterium]